MNCPKCENELTINIENDASNPTESLDIKAFCEKCDASYYTFANIKDFVDESEDISPGDPDCACAGHCLNALDHCPGVEKCPEGEPI